MFDLLLVLAFFVSSVFAGVLGRVMLSRASLVKHSSFSVKRAVTIGSIAVGLVVGTTMAVFTLVLTIASGEASTATRLIIAFMEGFVPSVVGVSIGFVATGEKSAN